MTSIPQRKKTPEELEKLRESLGILPDAVVAVPQLPPPIPLHAETTFAPSQDHRLPDLTPRIPPPLPVHSLKRSESPPQLLVEPVPEAPVPGVVPLGTAPSQVIPLAAPKPSRPIHSLKRSDHLPTPATATAPKPIPTEGKLPAYRHSEQEIAEIRRRDALAAISQGGFELPALAPPPLIALGYILAIGGAAAPTLLDWLSRLTESYTLGTSCSSGYHILTGSTLAALPIAAFIYFKKSLSHHHAAFIAIIVFFALVFAVLHYLPQLRYAT
ncbi:MAG: hypothetical protein NTW21_34025 [Verrucomicrobia bacterium]|nr:hypothetical protein [Verrucomicrobiota bacterium]